MNQLIRHSELPDLYRPMLPALPPDGPRRMVGLPLLIFGTIHPAGVILFELASRMCAEDFFDPMPTLWHAAVIALVPAANLLLWLRLQKDSHTSAPSPRMLAFANGAALAVGGFYSLIFLPITPLALLGLIFGIGLLPLAPAAAFISAIVMRARLRRRWPRPRFDRALWGGFASGLLLLVLPDVPMAITRLGMHWADSSEPQTRQRGIALLRAAGSRDLLLRFAYDSIGRPAGPLSLLLSTGRLELGHTQSGISAARAREIFYRVTGTAYSEHPAPNLARGTFRLADFGFDSGLGGSEVGERTAGLALVASRMDGSISSDSALAYLEWIFELRNTSALQREARLELALPPGGVVSRATLWINGEEREAAYGGRAQVRQAYQQVVQRRRDPLLVTTKGADRVLAQAFPVPPNGAIKFKLGITAPLALDDLAHGRLALPAIIERNFGGQIQHALWIESDQALRSDTAGLTVAMVKPRLFRLTGELNELELARARPAITAERDPARTVSTAALGDTHLIKQTLAPLGRAAGALIIVVDGSAKVAGHLPGIVAALERIPAGSPVGVIIAGEPDIRVPVAPWSEQHKQAVQAAITGVQFAGGEDNGGALAAALQALEATDNGALLWVHGPQPVRFAAGASVLEQVGARLARLPAVTLYQVEPGANRLLPDVPWAWSAQTLPASGHIEADLGGFLTRSFGGQAIAVTRERVDAGEGAASGSAHLTRLWARDEVLALMQAAPAGNREAATKLAAENHLVTPVSGAVVLETRQEFAANNLTPADASGAPIPTLPEPRDWLLLALAMAATLWFAYGRRTRPAVA
jgi:hypothetical protein